MDIATLLSMIFAFFALIFAFIEEGGVLSSLLQPTAALIVFGGTLGAVGVSFPFSKLKKVPIMLKKVFVHEKENREEIIETLLSLATLARRDGLLALEQEVINNSYDDFIVSGLQLVIDGADQDVLQHILETRINNLEDRHEKGISIFESAGGYSPTMGVIGTVMGLINVMRDLSDPNTLGPKIAVAFIATLYGVGTANIVWLPIASKLKDLNNDEVITKYMILEGILMIQNGSNPAFMKEQLKGYLENAQKEEKSGEQ